MPTLFSEIEDQYAMQNWYLETDWHTLENTRIDHELDVFDARRGTLQLAIDAGFRREQAYYLVTAMTELGNNIVFHSQGGNLRLNARYAHNAQTSERHIMGLQIVAADCGPGIVDTAQAIQEGYSSINSMGCGLSGVKRLMDEFTLHSASTGTEVNAVMWKRDMRCIFDD